MVKLGFTTVSLGLLLLAGKRLFPGVMQVDVLSFSMAVLLGTFSILSLGFVIASLVPPAFRPSRSGRSCSTPMLALSGLFFPRRARLPETLRVLAWLLPTTHTVALLPGRARRAGVGRAVDERRGARRAVRLLFRPVDAGLPLGVSPIRRAL